MYIKECQDGSKTVFEYTPILIPAVLAATSAFLMWVVVGGLFGLLQSDHPIGFSALGAVGMLVMAAWLCRREYMIFDPDRRTVTWSKWSLREHTGGEIPFDDIKHVRVEVTGSDGVWSHRLVIETAAGQTPMTSHFAGNPDHWEPIAERLRQIVGLKVDDPANADARSLIAEGKMAEAIEALRDAKNMSIAGATGLAEQLADPGPA